jgi:plasmid maintenance system antidote protein VapI
LPDGRGARSALSPRNRRRRRLSRYFGTTDRFWLNLQTRFDLETENDNLGPDLEEIQPLRSA